MLLDEQGHAYLADFGLTRRLSEQAPGFEAGLSLGTPSYVAPEQIEGKELDGRADQYSLACLLCECLTGEPPFRRSSEAATLFAHLEEPPPAPAGLESVLPRALAKEPVERYETCAAFVSDARRSLGLEPRRVRWPLALTGAGAVLVGVALLAFFLTSGGSSGPAPEPGADTLLRIDPQTNTVSKTMAVGRLANGVAADGRYVWVTNAGDSTVWRIDPETGGTLKLPAKGTPTGVATDGKTVAVADAIEHVISSYDAATGRLRFYSTLTGSPDWQLPIAAGAAGIWFADGSPGIAGKVDDALSNSEPSVRAPIPQPHADFDARYQSFDDLAVGQGAVWVAGDPFGRAVWRVDPAAGRVPKTIRLSFVPEAIAAGEGAVWVTSMFGDTVSRIDPQTGRIVATIPVGRSPDAIAAGGGAVWVTSSIDDTLTRIDPATNRVVAIIPLGATPRALAVGPDGVWIAAGRSPPPALSNAIKIGIYADCSGPFDQAYDPSLAAAELPLIQRGASRAGPDVTDGISGLSFGGRPVKLYFGCDDIGGSKHHGVIREVRRLVERVGVDILIGPTEGDSILALQPYMRRHPETTFVNGSGAEPLHNPAPNFFNFYTDGGQWNAGVGAYAYHHLGWRRAVIVADSQGGGRFAAAQVGAFVAEFCSLGGTIAKRIWIPFDATDLSTTVGAVPSRGVDGLFVSTIGLPVVQALAGGYPPLRGKNVSRRIVLSSVNQYDAPQLRRMWRRATGLVYAAAGGGPGLAPGSKYLTDFKKAFPHIPASLYGRAVFDLGYYDNAAAAVDALAEVHGDLSNGQRRFRAALSRESVDGPSGRVTLDADRRAVAPMYLYRLEGPGLTPHLIRTIPRVEPTFGGYFKASDPPPSETTPACVKRTPPPWAR